MMRPSTPAWTDAEKTELRRMWGEGLSGSEISRALGGTRSRASVLVMARRLSLPGRALDKSSKGAAGTKSGRLGRTLPLLAVSKPGETHRHKGDNWRAIPGTMPVDMMGLELGMCKWPIGDDRPYLFCGQPVARHNYCQYHHEMSVGLGSPEERAADEPLKEAA